MRNRGEALPVVHVVSAMSGNEGELWGKERVVATLMCAQRDSGQVLPRLVTFAPCALGTFLCAEGFEVDALDSRNQTVPLRAMMALRQNLARSDPAIVHTHGYKANIVGRIARAGGVHMRGLVSTCHGWIDEPRLRLYNQLDRATSPGSDIVTVTDQAMLSRFSRRARTQYVANGIDDRNRVTPDARRETRAQLHFPSDRLVIGTLGRIERAKGVAEVVEAARLTADWPVQWVLAGSGPLERDIRAEGLANVTVLGYVAESDRYLDAIDVYLQASHGEGLSLALLEAMRAGRPIIATRVGSTGFALRSEFEGLLVPPGDVDGILAAVRRLLVDGHLAPRLGSAARERFERAFHIRHQHEAFLDIYSSCDRMHA